jgi:uncharacterized protein with PIN domain
LQYQPPDCVQASENVIVSEEEDDLEQMPAKRQRLDIQNRNQKVCPKCNSDMKKKTAFTVPTAAQKKIKNNFFSNFVDE